MSFPDRIETDHLPLAALEVAAVPLAVLATLLLVVLAGVVTVAIGAVGTGLGVSAAVLGVLDGVVALLAVLALVAGAGGAVEAYRRRFRASDRGSNLLATVALPLAVVGLALVYAAIHLLSPPSWLVAVAAVSAHAVAFRTVALYALPDDQRYVGAAVGAVAGIPVALALVAFVTGTLLGGVVAEPGRLVVGALEWTGLPRHGLLLVVLPLLTAAGYGARRTTSAADDAELPDGTLSGAVQPIRSRLPDALSDLGGLADRVSSSEPSPRSPQANDSRVAHPPVSARSSSREREHGSVASSSGDSADRSDGSSSSSSGSGGSSSASGSSGASGSSSSSDSSGSSGSSGSGSESASAGGSSGASAGSGGSSSRGSSAGGSSSGSSGSASSSGASGSSSSSSGGSSASSGENSSASGSGSGGPSSSSSGGDGSGAGGASSASSGGGESSGGTGSDTRIFTGDFGSYDDGGSSVDTCPACDEEIPSDGVYQFCPFCGEEL